MPRVRTEVALQYIYPDEDAALLACPAVDLGHRVLFGFLDRAGWRREEALGVRVEEVSEAVEDAEQKLEKVPSLTWRRVDTKHAIVHMDREKTGRPRPVPIDADIVRALEAWRKFTPKPADDDFVFVDIAGRLIDAHDVAQMLRADLVTAGVDRAELHDASSPMRRPIAFMTFAPRW
jgi:site-specific recombinase XerC